MADTAKSLNEAAAKNEKRAEDELTRLVGSEPFSRMMAETMGTTMGVAKLWNDSFELLLRGMRLPSQSELTRISRQIARLEDKLEDVLIAVERLEEQSAAKSNGRAPGRPA